MGSIFSDTHVRVQGTEKEELRESRVTGAVPVSHRAPRWRTLGPGRIASHNFPFSPRHPVLD